MLFEPSVPVALIRAAHPPRPEPRAFDFSRLQESSETFLGGVPALLQIGFVSRPAFSRKVNPLGSSTTAFVVKMLSQTLSMPDREVHRVLLADGGVAAPTKANLQAVLAKLAGKRSSAPWLKHIPEVGPDDLVVLSFAGHGYAPDGGAFHLMLSDLERGADEKSDLDPDFS